MVHEYLSITVEEDMITEMLLVLLSMQYGKNKKNTNKKNRIHKIPMPKYVRV